MTLWQVVKGLAALPAALRELQQVGTLRLLSVGPDDVLVIETEAVLSIQGRENLTIQARKLFPDIKVVILDSGFRMSVIKGGDIPRQAAG